MKRTGEEEEKVDQPMSNLRCGGCRMNKQGRVI